MNRKTTQQLIPLKKDGTTGKVTFNTQGSRNNGRYVEKTSAAELMSGISNDLLVVDDITYIDCKLMYGFLYNYVSEDNFILLLYVACVMF